MAQRTAPYRSTARSWAAARYLGGLWGQLLHDARALPAEAWRRWLRATLIGTLLTCALAAGLTLGARWAEPRGLQAWDAAALPVVIERSPLDFAGAGMVETPGNLFGMVLLVGAGVLLAIRAGRPLIVVSLLSLYWVGTAVLWAGWLMWGRDRPDLVAGGIAAPGLHSFPSGHILHVVALYGFLAYLWWRATRSWAERLFAAALYVVFVAGVAAARLELGAHWPSDILGGALVGLAWLVVGVVALRHAEDAGGR